MEMTHYYGFLLKICVQMKNLLPSLPLKIHYNQELGNARKTCLPCPLSGIF